jgi:dienelactone hydrolase
MTSANTTPRTLASDLERIRAAVAARPWEATAAAAGVGFVLGGGLTLRMLALLIETGTRMAASWLAESTGPAERADAAAEDQR